jgi:ubiquinone/menaquinone biosynthesis C-methylase UbiE
MSTILDHNHSLRSDFLHAHGEMGTEMLLNKLIIQGSEKIVEFGFGTGATLIKLKSRYLSIQLKGIDASFDMIKTATNRIKFCGLKNNIELFHTSQKDMIQKKSIDIIYIESVLGILDHSTLKETLSYLNKILKEKGTIVINESIWFDSISEKQIETINQHCLETFGIIQCNKDFSSIDKTIHFF